MPLNTPRVQYDLIRLGGGLDQVTPTLSLPPGVARRAANFEASITGGYTRIAGYERYDGQPNPSDATYNLLVLSAVTPGSIALGDVLVGAVSAASATVIAITGAQVVVTRETLTFVEGEQVLILGTPVGTIASIEGQEADGALDAAYKALAADNYRADIQAVPGSGPVLGVAYFNNTVFAWRNNVGGTAAGMFESTGSGWTAVPLGKELSFTTGTIEIFAGTTVVGAVSGATGLVSKVALESGSWAAGTAAGRLILSGTTGTFNGTEALQISSTTYAISSSAAVQITLAPGGHYETVVGNFGGGLDSFKLYGCSQVNRAFEFDGTTYAPIRTGMTVDTPQHIAFHKQHLFLSFGASLQFSALGEAFNWTPLLGAGELALSGLITNLLVLPGDQSSGSLAVYTRNDTSVLYGTGADTFQLSTFNSGTGAIAHTAQNMDQAYVLDDRGVMSLQASLAYGNFATSSLTMNIRPFIQQRRNLAVASLLNREKGQYRIFFSDGTGVYLTLLNGKMLGAMPVQFPDIMTCACEGEFPDGTATSFLGGANGFVYRLDAGTSFDGLDISANINLVYNSIKSPRILKRFRKASVELTGDSYAEIAFAYDLAYRSTALAQAEDALYSNDLRSSYWDGMTWDNFVWDGSDISPSEIEVEGTAENMAIRISSVSAILEPFTVNNIIVHYTPRRGLR